MAGRTYREVDLKKLFALSHNVCAFPSCDQKLADPGWSSVQAEIAHIRGLHPGSARYDSAMTDDERNSFENLLLLCPNHHNLIDDLEPANWSTERLMELKAAHELQRREDNAVPRELIQHALACLVASGRVNVDGIEDTPDVEAEWLDPATGMSQMLGAVAKARVIEARHFDGPLPLDTEAGWVELGLAIGDFFDLLVAQAVSTGVGVEDLIELRRLRDTANASFSRIPGC